MVGRTTFLIVVTLAAGLWGPVLPAACAGQGGDSLEYAVFAERLAGAVPAAAVPAIVAKLPPASKIYGYDVGDISGDSLPDVVLSLRNDRLPPRAVRVYVFRCTPAGAVLLRVLDRRYIADPIEVGFSIEDGVCSITEKQGEFDWEIVGYAVLDGVFRRVSLWETYRLKRGGEASGLGYTRAVDLVDGRAREQYFGANSHREFLANDYFTVPLYPDSLVLPRDLPALVGGALLVGGASSWSGDDDCSLRAGGRVGREELRLDLLVRDDRIITDTAVGGGDWLDLHFNISRQPRLEFTGRVRDVPDEDLLTIRIRPGGAGVLAPRFEKLRGRVKDGEFSRVRIEAAPWPELDNATLYRVFLPLRLFGGAERLTSTGFCAAYHDVDVREHPDWVTTAALSRSFDASAPETFASFLWLSDPDTQLEREDMRLSDLLARMRAAGLR